MEEEEMPSSPFWIQSRRAGRRSPSSSFLFNSGVLLLFLLVVGVAFILTIIPSIQSFTSLVFKPQSVKKSWDSLNLVLVLFAVICGFLSRNNGDNKNESTATATPRTSFRESYKFENRSESLPKSNPETPRRFWYDQAYDNRNNGGGLSSLRSFSSHPDLRQAEESLWMNRGDNHQWRFYDDTHLYNNRFSSFDHHQQLLPMPKPQVEEEKEAEKETEKVDDVDLVKQVDEIGVEESKKEIIYTSPPTSEKSDPSLVEPPLSQTKVVRRRVRRNHQDDGRIYLNKDSGARSSSPPSPSLPPELRQTKMNTRVKRNHQENNGYYPNRDSEAKPSPSPPAPMAEEGAGKNEKKRGATSATKEFLISLRRMKKKKQRQKSVEDLDSFFSYEFSYPLPPPSSLIPPPSPPPPPPTPPPPPFFHNIFSSKKQKAKKIPDPPPPPPPARTQKLSTSGTSHVPFATEKPAFPVKIKSYGNVDDNETKSGNESPLNLNSIPPPPPLPPFKMSGWKYEVLGNYVRLKSNNSNMSDDVEESSSPSEGGDSSLVRPFCPSPDVDTKADDFIARFRAGLRMEKQRSNLGPEPSPLSNFGYD